MARNQRAKHPLGYQAGDCWGRILDKDPAESLAAHAARHGYKHGGKNARPMLARLMVKFEEIEKYPAEHVKALARIRRAQSYGCEIQLVIDCFNKAARRQDYHRYIYMPRDRPMWRVVRDLVQEIQPEQVEVFNEFWYTKGSEDMTIREYRGHVFDFARGLRSANLEYQPLLVASIELDQPRDSPHDLWVWDVEWDKCAEAYHFNILTQPGEPIPMTPQALRDKLQSQAYCANEPPYNRNNAIGWIWPLMLNEGTPVGDRVNLNTQLGREMMKVWVEHHQRYKMPHVMLTMGGSRAFNDEGEWGMETNFISNTGEISKGFDKLLDMMGAPEYEPGDVPIDPPDDPPIDPPSGGLKEIHRAQRDLRVAEKHYPGRVSIEHLNRTIAHCENAIGRS